jgi:chloramphenicol-sensitive protein RarD
MNPGYLYALAAYAIWGVIPIYFKQVAAVPAAETLAQRMCWSLLVCIPLLLYVRRGRSPRGIFSRPRRLLVFFTTATLLAANWGTYIWAVNSNHLVDASLGYFITPLLMVLIGAFLLDERLRRAQWLAVAIAAAGVVWLTAEARQLPWIGLVLAGTWSVYGVLRKTATTGAVEGLSLETALLFPFALAYLLWLSAAGHSAFAHGPAAIRWWLVASGPITAAPLLFFAAGAHRIAFAHLGILQYLAPTLQLLVGVLLYGEAFAPAKAIGYALIWIALTVFAIDGLWQLQRQRVVQRVK